MALRNTQPIKKSTLASLLSKPSDLSRCIKELPIPLYCADSIVVKIKPKIHHKQVDLCKTNFIGRIILRPRSKPMVVDDLKAFLQKVWGDDTFGKRFL